jgi:hypothetical protein
MQEPSQEQPKPRNSAGYRPLVPAELTRSIGPSAYGYVAAAVALGLATGVAIALTGGHAKVAAAPGVSAATGTHASGASILPAAHGGPAPSRLSQAENRKKTGAGLLSTVSEKSSRRPARAHKRHGIHKVLDWKKANREYKAAKRRPYISPNPPPSPDQPTALELATSAEAAGPFFLDIQGDVTVANYDSASGTIETYEGETYLLAKNAGESGPIPWQDYPFDVHYRCDDIGNCTLFRGGASAAAKLTR